MKAKVSVIHAGAEAATDLARYARIADSLDDISGSDVVIVGGDVESAAEAIRVRAPAATVLVTADPVAECCENVYRATLFPRARVIGIAEPRAAAAAALSVLLGDGGEHEVVARADATFAPCRARLGPRGIAELL